MILIALLELHVHAIEARDAADQDTRFRSVGRLAGVRSVHGSADLVVCRPLPTE